jgi:Glycosyl transferase family 2
MTRPELSVVVASVNGFPYLAKCLDALRRCAPQAEVIVADSTEPETRGRVQEGWPGVQLLSFEEPMPVPKLRAAGMNVARGSFVAVIEDHCVVTEAWADAIVEAHAQGHPVVGGPIRNAATDRLRDWAAFLCEYSEHMEPLPEGPAPSLAGMNVSYGRRAIGAIDEFLRRGFWETWLHPHLQQQGFELWCASQAVLLHDKDFGVGEFLAQRYHFARSYAGLRNPELGRKRALYCLGTPLLIPLVYTRILRNVLRRGRHKGVLAKATPLMLVYICVWAAGEAVGYAFGGGKSILRVK